MVKTLKPYFFTLCNILCWNITLNYIKIVVDFTKKFSLSFILGEHINLITVLLNVKLTIQTS